MIPPVWKAWRRHGRARDYGNRDEILKLEALV